MCTIGGLGLYIGRLSVNYWPTIGWWSTGGRLIHDRYFLHTWPVLDRYFTTSWSLCMDHHASVNYWSSISPLLVNCPLIDRPRPPIAHMFQVSYTWSVAQSRAGILVNNHKAQLLLGTFGLLFIEKLRSQWTWVTSATAPLETIKIPALS